MRIDRFYLSEPVSGDIITVTDADVIHQWMRVFRMKKGSKLVVFDGSGAEYEAIIRTIQPEKAELDVAETRTVAPVEPAITLAVALIKRDKFEWVLEKGTELGVRQFVPLVADRSDKKDIKMERAQKIVVEAAEQSGRGDVPDISEPTATGDFVSNIDTANTYVLDLAGAPFHESVSKNTPATFLIGPEGGWSDSERELFLNAGLQSITLGSQILKTETAAVSVAASVVLDK
ncbi:MAG: RsmE family RNA methyltransferase [Candidatus Paceibacterota bacterium]